MVELVAPSRLLTSDFGAPASFSPGLIDFWYDATQGLTQAGGFVSAWADRSGRDRTMAQSTALNRPTYDATGLNGLPCVEFATGQFMEAALADSPQYSGNTGFSIFVVMQPGVNSVVDDASVIGQDEAGFVSWSVIACQAALSQGFMVGGVTRSGTQTYDGAVTGVLMSCIYDGGVAQDVYADGVLDNGAITGLVPASMIDGAKMRMSVATKEYIGKVGEVIGFNSALNPTQQGQVEAYLINKWGI
jgi:hypothetical protein